MKKWFLMVVVLITFSCKSSDSVFASSGEVIEALFISQNKLKEVLEHISWLKKELTECSVACSPEKMAVKKGTTKQRVSSINVYHCQLKHLIFPGLIQELELLAVPIAAGIDELAKDMPVLPQAVKRVVSQAFLLKDRVEAEQQLLSTVLKIDLNEEERELKIRETVDAKRKLPELRASFAAVNNKIYSAEQSAKNRVYLEKLQCYRECV